MGSDYEPSRRSPGGLDPPFIFLFMSATLRQGSVKGSVWVSPGGLDLIRPVDLSEPLCLFGSSCLKIVSSTFVGLSLDPHTLL